MAEEEELELSLGTKKEKKSKSKSKPASDPAVDAAAKGVEAVDLSGGARPAAGATSTSTSYHDYMFLLERLYLTHNDRFGVDKDKEKSRCGLRLHRRVFFTIDCSGSKCPRHK